MELHDSGHFYVYENGQLTDSFSKKRNPYRSYHHTVSKNQESSESGQTNEESHRCQRVTSLLEICFDFIGNNILSLDSLIDFPDSMGKAIFESSLKKNFFSYASDDDSKKVLQMFCSAYGQDLMTELKVTDYKVLELHTMSICSFLHLTKLDFSGCRIGDKHQVLQFAGQLSELLHLSLQDNCISDDGLRSFTAPLRILRRGPAKLQLLDLSYNPKITSNSCRYIQCFHSLRAVQLTGTGVQVDSTTHTIVMTPFSTLDKFCFQFWKREANSGSLFEAEKMCLSLQMVLKNSEIIDFNCVSNKGWAAPVVNNWLSQAATAQINQSSTASDLLPTACFYRKSKTVLKATAERRSGCEVIVLVSPESIDSTSASAACEASSPRSLRTPARQINTNSKAGVKKVTSFEMNPCEFMKEIKETYSISQQRLACNSSSSGKLVKEDQSVLVNNNIFFKSGVNKAGPRSSTQLKPGKPASIRRASLIDALNSGEFYDNGSL